MCSKGDFSDFQNVTAEWQPEETVVITPVLVSQTNADPTMLWIEVMKDNEFV